MKLAGLDARRSWGRINLIACAITVCIAGSPQGAAQEGYRTPPEEIVRMLDAPPAPFVSVDPSRRVMALMERESLPPISDLARPMLRLAGSRINPETNGPFRTRSIVGISLMRIEDGRTIEVELPAEADISGFSWSPDGARFAFTLTRENGIELWTGETRTGSARALTGPVVNPLGGPTYRWLSDGRRLVCSFVPDGRGDAPEAPSVPSGPTIRETSGRVAPVRTYQDLLENAHDEALYEHYFTQQLAVIDVVSGSRTNIGSPAIYRTLDPSPDASYLLVSRLERPFSHLVPASRFPEVFEVWTLDGEVVTELVRVPLRDVIPIQGVQTGPRSIQWRDTAPHTLVWLEALDEGDPRNEVEHRDRIMTLQAPFSRQASEVTRLEHRSWGVSWLDEGGLAMLREFDRDRRWSRTWLFDFDRPQREPRLVWDLSVQDRYNAPGSPVTTTNRFGRSVVLTHEGSVYLTGAGAGPEGDRPFMDRMSLESFETERLWRCAEETYEYVVSLLSPDASMVLTRFETTQDPPNYYARSLAGGRDRALTDFEDPQPELRNIHRELVTYEREDGVQLSATLYLPADYREGERLPLVVWAYPREFIDASTAGQVSGSPHRFTRIGGSSHMFFLTQGYAIMDGAAMPVIGDAETANDTFIEQVVSSGKAAIDKAVEMGVADPERVGVGGHSYGAFMTGTLLAHSDHFRAGIARSGAYNRTLTPFGFQSERRTLWEAPEIYFQVSPFMHADKINEPVLLIHGEIDNNSGTYPMQSERMYHAIKGHGGTARLVMLPYESHGYAARESVLHALAEMIDWFDMHVKGAESTGARSR
ncbi:MAG: S9 family peptidase [Phycisphaeraceae bacterium]|nr:MAG: S9 family peptidase [Phycisphaeraceae bacterium]